MFSTSSHQAAGLTRRNAAPPTRVIAVTSGKGGVGKTSVAVNLSMALAMAGRDVVLLDADLGLANVDVQLGLTPSRTLAHLLDGQCTLDELLLAAPRGLKVAPATSGTRRMAQLGSHEHAALINAFSGYRTPLDALVIDTAAGIAESVTLFSRAAHEVVVVVCDEPASITDAYALIKVLSREYGVGRFRVLTNMVSGERQGRELYQKILRVTDRFLDVVLDYFGAVPQDEDLRRAVRRQAAVVDAFPGSRAAQAFQRIARIADQWAVEPASAGHLAFMPGQAVGPAGVLEGISG